jgi:transketolase
MMTNREAYGQALAELGTEKPDVVVLEADLGRSTMTCLFGERFPDRYFNMGVAEANMMGTAAGLAANGKIPYASTFCIFASLRAGEQVRNSIAYPNLNVKIVATNAGIEIGADGATHQATEDVAVMRAIPNMTVVVPSDPVMTTKLVKLAAEARGPLYMRLGRQPTPFLYGDEQLFEFGTAMKHGVGADVTLVAMGNMVWRALETKRLLAGDGIDARVLDMHTVKPMDEAALLEAAQQTGCVVTAEDHNVVGGLGGAVSELLSSKLPVPVVRVGLQDTFAQSGETEALFAFYSMTPTHIATAARKAMQLRDGKG